MSQPDLFTDWPEPPSVPAPTSVAAAKAIEPVSGQLRRDVYEFIQGRGDEGATDEEIQGSLGMDANTERPRRRELQLAGYIQDSGRTRQTRSGRKAVVWTVAGVK